MVCESTPLNIISSIYDDKSSFDINWIKLYREMKQLSNECDPNIQPEHNDTGFCIDLLLHILSTVKNQPHLFNDGIGVSEWDYIVKFWGMVTERLFHHTNLRLKWGDTHLTVSDTISDLLLKVDMRILHDSVRQRFNVETDLGVLEAAEEDPGDVKYTSDRCKVTIESKAIIDKFVLDGCLIDSVDSLQVSGLELHFGRTTLARPGLYIADQFYTTTIDKSLNNISRYFDLACHLLCFRDQCIQIYNKYEDHLTNSRTKKIATKRNFQYLPEDELVLKQSYIRGSWSPPRTSKTTPPPPPKKLFGTTE
ncbi:hypothetical protein EDC94DRAFT_638353 [Helicostylum pulchrum]|nr:hypothetical protein EDC94DRAFT_638353 [Helicostylum pulchrum]